MNSPIRKLASQTAIYGLSSILGRLINYLLVPLYTRVFSRGDYGIVTELYAYVSFMIIIFTYGMETAYFRFATTESAEKKENAYTTALVSMILSSVFLCGALMLFSSPLARAMEYGGRNDYLIYFALILGMDAVSTIPFARLRQENKALQFASIKLANIFINIAANLYFIWYLRKPIEYIFISNLIASALTLVLLVPFSIPKNFSLSFSLVKEMLFFGLPLLFAGLAGMTNENIDRIFIRRIMGEESVGVYGACYKLSIFMSLFTQMFRYAAEPFFFHQSVEENAKRTYSKVLTYFTIFGLMIFLAVSLFLNEIVLVLGKDFREGMAIVPILLLANLFLGIYYNFTVWFKVTARTKWGFYIALWGALVTIASNLILIPRIGIMGGAYATLICYGSMAIISYVLGQKFYPVSYEAGKLSLYILFASGLYYGLNQFEFTGKFSSFVVRMTVLILFLIPILLIERRNYKSQNANNK